MPALVMLLLTFGLPPAALLGLVWMARFEATLAPGRPARAVAHAGSARPVASESPRAA